MIHYTILTIKQQILVLKTAVYLSRAARYSQPCVNGDWLCQWEMAIFDPHRMHTP